MASQGALGGLPSSSAARRRRPQPLPRRSWNAVGRHSASREGGGIDLASSLGAPERLLTSILDQFRIDLLTDLASELASVVALADRLGIDLACSTLHGYRRCSLTISLSTQLASRDLQRSAWHRLPHASNLVNINITNADINISLILLLLLMR